MTLKESGALLGNETPTHVLSWRSKLLHRPIILAVEKSTCSNLHCREMLICCLRCRVSETLDPEQVREPQGGRGCEDRVLDGPASWEKGSKGRNVLDCIL